MKRTETVAYGWNSKAFGICSRLSLGIFTVISCYWILVFFQYRRCVTYKRNELRELCYLYERQVVDGGLCEKICGNLEEIVKETRKHDLNFPTLTFISSWHGKKPLLLKSLFSVVDLTKDSEMIKIDTPPYTLRRAALGLLQRDHLAAFRSLRAFDYTKDQSSWANGLITNSLVDNGWELVASNDISALSEAEFRTIWLLVQQPEFVKFLFSSKYVNLTSSTRLAAMGTNVQTMNYYPAVHGVCGPYYAVEHITPLQKQIEAWSHIPEAHENNTREKWRNITAVASSLIDFTHKLDNSSGVHGCDLTANDIGVKEDLPVSVLNGAKILSSSVLNLMMGKQKCLSDEDCAFFQCQFRCNYSTQLCQIQRLQTHIQMYCRRFVEELFQSTPVHVTRDVRKIIQACEEDDVETAKINLARLKNLLGSNQTNT